MIPRSPCRALLLVLGLFIVTGTVLFGQLPKTTTSCSLKISKDTTYITEPLDSNGRPDYTAALNKRLSEGVTPSNNAVVLFLQACKPSEVFLGLSEEGRKKYLKMLGIASLPKNVAYLVEFDDYVKNCPDGKKLLDIPLGYDNSLWDQYTTAELRPWSKQEFPFLAAWLAAIEKPLAQVIEASKRPRYFNPFVPRQKSSQLPQVSDAFFFDPAISLLCRRFARTLRIRAMSRLHEGKVSEAWEDLLACHRLARLIGQAPTSLDAIIATGIEEGTLSSDRELLQNGLLTSDQLARIREDISRLGPMPNWADKFDVGDRFSCLNWALRFTCAGLDSLKRMLTDDVEPGPRNTERAVRTTLELIGTDKIDWNIVFRTINSCFDQVVDAHCAPTRSQQIEALNTFYNDLMAQAEAPYDPKNHPREAYSRRIGFALFFTKFLQNTPTIAHDRVGMTFEVLKLAFALAQYHADCGSYPANLADLVPKYIAEVPKDIFNNKAELRYKKENGGCLVYSVGINGIDDGGRTFEDRNNATNPGDWDDIVVRLPAAKEVTPQGRSTGSSGDSIHNY